MPPTLPQTFEPRRILVRGVNWQGDAVMTLPALIRLRERFPEAHISLLTHEKLEQLWQEQPFVDQVIPFAKGDSVLKIAGLLRGGQFDLSLILPNSPRSALESWWNRALQHGGSRGH